MHIQSTERDYGRANAFSNWETVFKLLFIGSISAREPFCQMQAAPTHTSSCTLYTCTIAVLFIPCQQTPANRNAMGYQGVGSKIRRRLFSSALDMYQRRLGPLAFLPPSFHCSLCRPPEGQVPRIYHYWLILGSLTSHNCALAGTTKGPS